MSTLTDDNLSMCARHINYRRKIQESQEQYHCLGIDDQQLTVLEIGMGIGHLSHYLMTRGHTVIATDTDHTFGWVAKDLRIIYDVAYQRLMPQPQKRLFEYHGFSHQSVQQFQKLNSYLPQGKKYDLILFVNSSMHHGPARLQGTPHVPDEKNYRFLVQELFKLCNSDARFIMGFVPEWDDYHGYGCEFLYQHRIKNPNVERLFGHKSVEFHKSTLQSQDQLRVPSLQAHKIIINK